MEQVESGAAREPAGDLPPDSRLARQRFSRRQALQGAVGAAFALAGAGLLPDITDAVASTGAAGPFTEYRAGCSVEFLIDGVALYRRIHELLEEVALVPPDESAYVHVALWSCDAFTLLMDPAPPSEEVRFGPMLRACADAGHEVKVTLWRPGNVAHALDKLAGYLDLGNGFAQVRAENEATEAALAGYKTIEVALLTHPQPAGSYHDKIFIFSIGERVTAIVGGMNMAVGYRGAPPYNGARFSQNWHDVAVQFEGPATSDVEAEWERLWRLGAASQPMRQAAPPKMVGADSIEIDVTAPSVSGVAVPYSHIGAELQVRVDLAERYVYLENYAIHDPELISRIGARIAATRRMDRAFQVILVVANPREQPYAYLHYITYKHLAFMSCDAFTYDPGAGRRKEVVHRQVQGRTRWTFAYRGNWYQQSVLLLDGGREIPLTSADDFVRIDPNGTSSPAFFLYSPSCYLGGTRGTPTYVHAKVSLFDDQYAGVGSANFNTRSLRFDGKGDGEITAFVHGSSVAPFRQALWDLYFAPGSVPSPAQWRARAEANLTTLAKGAGVVNRLYMLPVLYGPAAFEPPTGLFYTVTDAGDF